MMLNSLLRLRSLYLFILALGLLATSYISLRSTIEPPGYPELKLKSSMMKLGNSGIESVDERNLKKDSSDRKLSPLYTYTYSDGSRVHTIMVRVAKKDDLKIEGYGLLTKDITPIYIKYPKFLDKPPFSMIGTINNKLSFQTCLIPKTNSLDQVDVRLFPLRNTITTIAKHNKSFTARFFGSTKVTDLSCLVVTYQPGQSLSTQTISKTWMDLLKSLQAALI